MILKAVFPLLIYVLSGHWSTYDKQLHHSKIVDMAPEAFRDEAECEKRRKYVESARKGAEVECALTMLQPEKEAKK